MEASHPARRGKNLSNIHCVVFISQMLIFATTITLVTAGSEITKGSDFAHTGYETVKLVAVKTSDKMLESMEPKSVEIPTAKFMMSKVDSDSVSMPHSMIKHGALMASIKEDSKMAEMHDLSSAAGEHKKYVLVKKKPKMKKIKMEVYKPKMKYKKIKIKVPVKKMKKKKVKGYMVKKHHEHY